MNTIKRIFAILGLMALLIGLMGITPVSADTTSDTETMELNKPQILKSTAKFRGKSIKVKACKAYAEKLEQQAPPRDPQALCKGKLKVKLSGIAKSGKCPEGWFGGRAEVRVTLIQSVKARAFAKSVASGRVRTWARFKIRDKAKIQGTATTTCMRIPEEEPPTHDECPDIPGDQPEGYECEPEPEPEAPTASGSAKACVKQNEQTGVITAVGTNPNDVSASGTLTVGGQTYQFPNVGAGQSVTRDFSGFAPGTYTGSFSLSSPINMSATFQVTVQQCASTPKPVLVEISTINDVLVNNSRTNTVSGSVAPGHTGSLFCTARNGGTITQGKQQTVSGNFSVQHTYLAPSEVPGANSQYGIAAGRDRVDCTLTQDDGQTATISTNQFEIRPEPEAPM